MGAVSNQDRQFPIGLRVLLVDPDLFCLKGVASILKQCQYNVTTSCQPMEALRMLREDKNRFEIVLVDVSMPEIDGFQLLRLIRLEMDIPVIILSSRNDLEYVKKGIQYGACNYLRKPCRISELRNIWWHVVKRRLVNKKVENSRNQDDEQALAQPENPKISDDSIAGQKRKNRNEGEEDKNKKIKTEDRAMTQKKPRFVWSESMHKTFLVAIDHLSLEKAAPKKILDWMNVEGLSRENVASHLQKYRLSLKRTEAAQREQDNMRSMESFGLPESLRFGAIGESHGTMRPLEINPVNNLSGVSYPTRLPNDTVTLTSSINSRPRFIANLLPMQRNQHVPVAAPVTSKPFDSICQGVHLSSFPSTGFGPSMKNAVENPHRFRTIEPVNCTQKPNGEEHKPCSGQNPNHSTVNPPPLDGQENSDIPESIIQSDGNNASNGEQNNFNAKIFFNLGPDGFLQSNYDAFDDMVKVDYQQEPNHSPTEEVWLWQF